MITVVNRDAEGRVSMLQTFTTFNYAVETL